MRPDRVLSIAIQNGTILGSTVTITSSPINQPGNIEKSTGPQGDLMPVPVQKIN